MTRIKRLALIGKDISHSGSPGIYKKLIENVTYDLIDISNEKNLPELESLFRIYDGISITAPYKGVYFPGLTVNTIRLNQGEFEGILTDRLAFNKIFDDIYLNDSLKVIVLGDGAMGKMVVDELKKSGVSCDVHSRLRGNLNQKSINLTEKSLIINTCSRDFKFNFNINSECIFWDFNYNFAEHEALIKLCNYVDGTKLLETQAKYAIDFWENKSS